MTCFVENGRFLCFTAYNHGFGDVIRDSFVLSLIVTGFSGAELVLTLAFCTPRRFFVDTFVVANVHNGNSEVFFKSLCISGLSAVFAVFCFTSILLWLFLPFFYP